jgi:hypothetical protein
MTECPFPFFNYVFLVSLVNNRLEILYTMAQL